MDGKKIPTDILDETTKKSEEITYDLNWKRNDLLMLDNKRFMHGRRAYKKNDPRDIVNLQTSRASFGYGGTLRKKIKT